MTEVPATNVFRVDASTSVPKEEYYKGELQGVVPEAFFLLGGGNNKRKASDKFSTGKVRFTTSPYKGKFYYDENPKKRKTGGAKARPIAAAELGKFYPDAKIVTMSHRPAELYLEAEEETQPKDQPPFAEVLAQDLHRLGAKNEIIQEAESTSTFTELIEVVLLTTKHGWKTSAVVTNDYQIERAQIMLDALRDDDKRKVLRNQLSFLFSVGEETQAFDKTWEKLDTAAKKFNEEKYNVVFVSAENVLQRRSPHHAVLLAALREDNNYINAVNQEKVGLVALRDGQYNFGAGPFKEYVLGAASSVGVIDSGQ